MGPIAAIFGTFTIFATIEVEWVQRAKIGISAGNGLRGFATKG